MSNVHGGVRQDTPQAYPYNPEVPNFDVTCSQVSGFSCNLIINLFANNLDDRQPCSDFLMACADPKTERWRCCVLAVAWSR